MSWSFQRYNIWGLVPRPRPLADATVEHYQSVRCNAEFGQPPGAGVHIEEAGDAAIAVEHYELDRHGVQGFHGGHRVEHRPEAVGWQNLQLPGVGGCVDHVGLPEKIALAAGLDLANAAEEAETHGIPSRKGLG